MKCGLPIQRDGAPFGEIRIGLSTVFLKSELQPTLNRALIFSADFGADLAGPGRGTVQPGAATAGGHRPPAGCDDR